MINRLLRHQSSFCSRKDSETYVRSKKKGCAEVGFESFGTDMPETASEAEVLKVRRARGKQSMSQLDAELK